jgi:hypothetical protein
MKKLIMSCTTNGVGLWSSESNKEVQGCMYFTLLKTESDGEVYGGTATFHFSKEDWDVDKYGLIYTDEGFLDSIHNKLKEAGFEKYQEINYSEQGMQGDDYVDFDASIEIVNEAKQLGYL